MTEYSLALALEDFIPVIFSSIGLYFISRMVAHVDSRLATMATAGWILITLGGLLKASWKLMMALSGTAINIVWMDKGMFVWMGVGFTLMAFAVWLMSEVLGGKKPTHIWRAPGIVLGLTLVAVLATGFPDPEVNTWRFMLLGLMTLGNVVLVLLLIQQARRLGQNKLAVLFIINIMLVFVLSGLARIPEQTIPLQWTEQLLNTFAQGAFAYASWKLAGEIMTEEVVGDLQTA
jgi:hypothetical protein